MLLFFCTTPHRSFLYFLSLHTSLLVSCMYEKSDKVSVVCWPIRKTEILKPDYGPGNWGKEWRPSYYGSDPFNQNSDRSDREKWSTSLRGRWTRFFETFLVGPNRSIEFWTEISGNFGWMDRALGPPQKVDQHFRNFSDWTEPIHWVLNRNFRKLWLNGSRPIDHSRKYNNTP